MQRNFVFEGQNLSRKNVSSQAGRMLMVQGFFQARHIQQPQIVMSEAISNLPALLTSSPLHIVQGPQSRMHVREYDFDET